MAAEFCVMDGCYEVAIGAARSRKHCRGHYNSEVLADADLIRFEVTADAGRVTDARTQVSHGKGAIVELDPQETRVAVLVAAGLGRVVTDHPGGAVPGEPTPADLSPGEHVLTAEQVRAAKTAKPAPKG